MTSTADGDFPATVSLAAAAASPDENRRGDLHLSLHRQGKHTIIVGRAVHPRPPTRATTDLTGESLFDDALLGDVAR
jgi:hypothetical protein